MTLIYRLKGWPKIAGHFALRRWGLPVNIVAVVFGVFLLVNVGWPRAAVYDPAGQSWVLHYSAPTLAAPVVAALPSLWVFLIAGGIGLFASLLLLPLRLPRQD